MTVGEGTDPVSAEAYSHEVIAFGFWPGDERRTHYQAGRGRRDGSRRDHKRDLQWPTPPKAPPRTHLEDPGMWVRTSSIASLTVGVILRGMTRASVSVDGYGRSSCCAPSGLSYQDRFEWE